MSAYACNPFTLEAEAGMLEQIWDSLVYVVSSKPTMDGHCASKKFNTSPMNN